MPRQLDPTSNSAPRAFKWDAFISYRRSDGTQAARWLRSRLQSFRLPAELRKAEETRSNKLAVFLDTSYERATEDFFQDILRPALEHSQSLIVIATPATLEPAADGGSNWVVREIEEFSKLPQGSNILVVRAKGEFNGPLPAGLWESRPRIGIVDLRDLSPLRFLRWSRFWRLEDELLKIIAEVHQVPQEKMPILLREEERRRRSRISRAFILGLILVGALALALVQKIIADRRAELAWILETRSLTSGTLIEKRKQAAASLNHLGKWSFSQEIRDTVISLLDKPDLEKVALPSVENVGRKVLADSKAMDQWEWINFAQARHAGASFAVSGKGLAVHAALSGAVPFQINVQTGLVKLTPEIGKPLIYPIALSPDGRFIAGRVDDKIRVFDFAVGLLGTIEGGNEALVRFLFFDPLSRLLVTTSDQSFSVWQLPQVSRICSSPSQREHELAPFGSSGLSIDPTGSLLAASQLVNGGRRLETSLWDIKSCRLFTANSIENTSNEGSPGIDPFARIAIDPNGRFLLQALGKQGLALWKLIKTDSATIGFSLIEIIQRGRGTERISVSPDGRYFLAVETESAREVSLFKLDGDKPEVAVISNSVDVSDQADVRNLDWSESGDFAFWTTSRSLELWRFNRPLSKEVPGPPGFRGKYSSGVVAAILSPSGRWLIPRQARGTTTEDHLRLIDLESSLLKEVIVPQVAPADPVVFLPNSEQFWVLGDSVELWSPRSNLPLRADRLPVFWVSEGAINSRGHRLVTRLGAVLDLDEGGKEILKVRSPFEQAASGRDYYYFGDQLSTDGSRYLVVRGQRYSEVFDLTLYDLDSGSVVLQVEPLEKVHSFALSSSGERIVVGQRDRALVFSSASSLPEAVLLGQPDEFRTLAISPDGSLIATAGESGRIVVWSAHGWKRRLTFEDTGVSCLTIRNKPPLLVSGHENGSLRIWKLDEVDKAVTQFLNAAASIR